MICKDRGFTGMSMMSAMSQIYQRDDVSKMSLDLCVSVRAVGQAVIWCQCCHITDCSLSSWRAVSDVKYKSNLWCHQTLLSVREQLVDCHPEDLWSLLDVTRLCCCQCESSWSTVIWESGGLAPAAGGKGRTARGSGGEDRAIERESGKKNWIEIMMDTWGGGS